MNGNQAMASNLATVTQINSVSGRELSLSKRLDAKLLVGSKPIRLDDVRDDHHSFPVLVGKGRALVEEQLQAATDAMTGCGDFGIAKRIAPLEFMPRRNASDTVIEMALSVYQMALSDLPGDVIDLAIKEHVRASKWFPMPAELREIADREMGLRRVRVRQLETWLAKQPEPQRNDCDEPIDPSEVDEMNAIMRRFRLDTRYRADGTAYQAGAGDE